MDKINENEIRSLLQKFDYCHDSSVVEVRFKKSRFLSNDGSLTYPFGDMREAVNCNIEVILLRGIVNLDPEEGLLVLNFYNVKSFIFSQSIDYDYSDVYEVVYKTGNPHTVTFFVTKSKKKALEIEFESFSFKLGNSSGYNHE